MMLAFCGQERGLVDANGRVKFSPRTQADFQSRGGGEVVLHCLPEGAVAVYPEEVYRDMRRGEARPAERAGESLVFRRQLRRFGALSQSERISPQGRITLPASFREYAGLVPGGEMMVVGVEIGLEIWSRERWEQEMIRIQAHMADKGEREMAADLVEQVHADNK
jgi:DNA-binding transcriptional regulator/RsmH inhibitor MraZ